MLMGECESIYRFRERCALQKEVFSCTVYAATILRRVSAVKREFTTATTFLCTRARLESACTASVRLRIRETCGSLSRLLQWTVSKTKSTRIRITLLQALVLTILTSPAMSFSAVLNYLRRKTLADLEKALLSTKARSVNRYFALTFSGCKRQMNVRYTVRGRTMLMHKYASTNARRHFSCTN